MTNEIQRYQFEESLIEFEIINGNVMVNATQMAKVFGKKIDNFTRIDNTKSFISECVNNANKRFISIESIEDLIISKQKSGTFMHRILALKFAAWLNPRFELWVYSTIDEILFSYYKRIEESLKVSAKRQNRIDELKSVLTDVEEFQELQKLEFEERQERNLRTKENKNQLSMFKAAIQ
jgi:hypothetical protein